MIILRKLTNKKGIIKNNEQKKHRLLITLLAQHLKPLLYVDCVVPLGVELVEKHITFVVVEIQPLFVKRQSELFPVQIALHVRVYSVYL